MAIAIKNSADLVKIGGKMMTVNRARALGLLDKNNAPKAGAENSPAVKGNKPKTGPVKNDARKAALALAVAAEEAVAQGKKPPKIKPLVPQNVTKDGEPVTDEATLAQIAAETAAIEAQHAAEREAAKAAAAAGVDVATAEVEDATGEADEDTVQAS